MNKPFRFLSILALALVAALPAFGQGMGAPQGSSQVWRDIEKQLGLQTTYSVDMAISAMGMNMDAKVFRDGDKSRTEMTMPMLNVKMAMLEIPEGGKIKTYSLFPEKKKYMADDDADAPSAPSALPKIEDLGTETFEGVACSKRRISTTEDGVKSDMTVLLSPKQKNMPVKMSVSANVPMQPGQPAMPMQTTILFKNYDFAKPDPSLFAVPAGYAKINDMMEIMMDGGAEGLGALFQQMQQQQSAE